MGKIRLLFCLAGILFASDSFAQLVVKLEGKGKCAEKAEVVLAREKNYLYHIQLPPKGTAEFKLLAGKYEFYVNTKSKCSARQEFTYEGKPKNIVVTLVHENKATHAREPSMCVAPPPGSADVGRPCLDTPTTQCICCGFGSPCEPEINYYSPFVMPYYHSMYYPWYRNWGNPCVYGGYGCQPQYFLPGGPVMLGKPNIYFEGVTKNLKIRFPDSIAKGLQAMSPAYLDKGWDIKTDGRMVIHKKVKYPYLYYDLRTSGEGLQFTSGFCGERTELLNKMLEGLKKLSFPERSIEDFKEHWGTHFPQGREYCVLPQTAAELEQSAPIIFSVPTTMTRVVYMVLPAKILPDEPLLDPVFKDYKPLTLKSWDPWAIKPAKDKLQAFEWGLAFTFSK